MSLSILLADLQTHAPGSLPWQRALHQMMGTLQSAGVGLVGSPSSSTETDTADQYAIALKQTWAQFCQPQCLQQLTPDRVFTHFQDLLQANLESLTPSPQIPQPRAKNFIRTLQILS